MDKLGIAGDPFAPYLFEFVSSGLLATATLWYGRGCDLPPDVLGEGVQAMLMGATVQAGMARRDPERLS